MTGHIVEAELRGINSDLKIGGGLRRNRGGVQRGGVRPPAFGRGRSRTKKTISVRSRVTQRAGTVGVKVGVNEHVSLRKFDLSTSMHLCHWERRPTENEANINDHRASHFT
jgi:hypothetical protein